MSFLKKHWRFTVPAMIVVCVMSLGVVVLYSTSQTPEEPARVYAMPKPSDKDRHVNGRGVSPQTLTTSNPRTETKAEAAELTPMETSSGANTGDDLEPLEECCDDEELLDNSTKSSLSKQEIEARVKIVKDFFDELDREFKTIEADREALQDRMTDLSDNYFAYTAAIADLLSPEYRQRFDEIESHDELTQAEKYAINDELHVIGKELGIDDMGEYMRGAAEEFADTFLALQASVDKLDERDMQLIKEMEGFSP